MDIVIPTRGRYKQQETLKHLLDAGLYVTLVVPKDEYYAGLYSFYEELHQVTVVPYPGLEGIAYKRQWIMETVGKQDAICMLDDDLTFFKRRTDAPDKLEDITPVELRAAFNKMECLLLDAFPHVGFAAREGANRVIASFIYNTRIMRVLGYNRRVLKKEGIAFGRIKVMEDFDVALSLLTKGYENVIINTVAHNQKGSGAVGGCSAWRTPQVQAQAALRLSELYPGIVKVVEKTTKTAWGGGTRTDVTIQWKKAYKVGAKNE
jgi:hypothetical protein